MPVIKSMVEAFPAQSMLLIQRVPLENSKETLVNWVFNRDGINQIAAMILAKTPDSAFVYRILKGLELNATLVILPPKAFYGTDGSLPGWGCPGGYPPLPPPGWPKVYDYVLHDEYGETGREKSNSTSVVELGSYWVSAERFEENRGPYRCSFGPSNDAFRHELIAYWLGITPADMPWQPYQTVTIVWTSKIGYDWQVNSITESSRAAVSKTILQLRRRGLLDDQAVDENFPPITFGVNCMIHPCPLQGDLVFKR